MDAAEQVWQLWSRFAEVVRKPRCCLFCGDGRRLWWDGWWIRTATILHEGKALFVPPFAVRRVKCGVCCRSWGLRPPGLFPHRHFQLCAIAQAEQHWLFAPDASLATAAALVCCSPRSVGRWARWLAALAAPGRLLSEVAEATGAPVLPRLTEVADGARKAASEAQQLLLRRAGQVLLLLEALSAALGLEPPGLRGVLLAAVGDRTHLATDASPLLPEVAWRRLRRLFGSIAM